MSRDLNPLSPPKSSVKSIMLQTEVGKKDFTEIPWCLHGCIWGWRTYFLPVSDEGAVLPYNGRPLEANWFMASASPQVSSGSAATKAVVVDSVTAVVSPLLGGQQREGKRCGRAQGPGCDPASQLWNPVPGQPSARCPAALALCFSSSRLGLDDAAGSRAEDPGPGPRRGGGGEEVGLAGLLFLPLLSGLCQGGMNSISSSSCSLSLSGNLTPNMAL